jgi:hypothetical protein
MTKVIELIKSQVAAEESRATDVKAASKVDPKEAVVTKAINRSGLKLEDTFIQAEGGATVFRTTIAEAEEGQYLDFVLHPGSEVLMLVGKSEQLPSIPVMHDKVDDLMTQSAARYFKSHLAPPATPTPAVPVAAKTDAAKTDAAK